MGFISQLIASGVSGAIGGSFVLWGVKAQFRSQCEAALRALLVEVGLNFVFAGRMVEDRADPNLQKIGGFLPGHPNPGWLKKSVWNSQLPYVVQMLDQETLKKVVGAYLTLEPLPQLIRASEKGMIGFDFPTYRWVDGQLQAIHQSFAEAKDALENFQTRLGESSLTMRARRLLSGLQKLVRT